MQVYAGLVTGYDGIIFMPGKYAEMDDVRLDPDFLLEPFPMTEVHRLLVHDINKWSADDCGPGSAFTIKYSCDVPSHDHYGKDSYAVVVHGEMEANDVSLSAANTFMDSLKGIYPDLTEEEVI